MSLGDNLGDLWRAVAAGDVDVRSAGLRRYAVALAGGSAEEGGLRLPVVVARGGEGPTVLVAGGTHGDEHEGPVAVSNLIRRLDPAALRGAIIALPFHNPPACRAGTRLTPLDGTDLNRLYGAEPAREGAGASIARFVTEVLLGPSDWVIDLHSGGATHEFVLSANLQAGLGSDEFELMLPALMAFDAPYAIVFDEAGDLAMPHRGTLEGLARRLGKRALSSELGGGGRATPRSLAVAERGLANLLAHIGVLPAGPARMRGSRLLALSRPDQHVPCSAAGRLAPRRWLGDPVRRGDLLGVVHPLEDPLAAPLPITALSNGVVVAVAGRGVQAEGAAVFYVAEPLPRAGA